MTNLVTNAVDAMVSVPTRARIFRVTAGVDKTGAVLISVEDSGPGIAPNDLDLIFEPRYTTKTYGMGMGLWICRSIIAAHGGRLTVSSSAGRGCVFQIVLPTRTSDAAPADPPRLRA